jgi:DNA-directed RNA polymerase specialized sigma24 family protein
VQHDYRPITDLVTRARNGELVDHLDDLRDPAALPGWLATTTRRQCFRVRQAAGRLPRLTGPLMDVDTMADTAAVLADHELILAERHAALREACPTYPAAAGS